MKMNIHNQCSDSKPTDRYDSYTFIIWNKEPGVEVDTGSMTSAVLTSCLKVV
jgi:hypothetical protein